MILPAHVIGRFAPEADRHTQGVVRFEPEWLTPHPTAFIVYKRVETPIVDGVARAALWPGRYLVSYRLLAAAVPSHVVTLTSEHTAEAPFELARVVLCHPLTAH